MSDAFEMTIRSYSSEQLEEVVKGNQKRLDTGEEDIHGLISETLFLAEFELKKRDGGKRFRDKEGNLRSKTWGNVVGCQGHFHGSIIPSDPNKCNYLRCGLCTLCGVWVSHKDTHGVQSRDYIEDNILEGMGVI